MDVFVILHGSGGSPEAAVIVIVEQDHAAGVQPGIEIFKACKNRGVKVGIQADQGKAAVIKAGGAFREKAFVEPGLEGMGKAAADKRQAGVGKIPWRAREQFRRLSSSMSRASKPSKVSKR